MRGGNGDLYDFRMTSPYTKAALFVLRLIAFGFVVTGFGLWAGDLFLLLRHRPTAGPAMLALKGLPVLAGMILFWKSQGLAERLTKDLD
jgi:hypothetical protein